MNNFQYYNPVRIVFGEGQITQLSELVPTEARVLITYGGGSAQRTGTLDEVKEALAASGTRTVFEFGGIEANPEFTTLLKAADMVNEHNIDFILAVGGGSVIDGSKFVALVSSLTEADGTVSREQAWDALTGYCKNLDSAVDLGAVLTIPATGSEMNSGGVINYSERQAKLPFGNPLAFPKFSILDPVKTLTLPERQVMNGVADAFVHVMEQYLTYPVNAKVQDAFAESLLKILIDEGQAVAQDPENLETRKNIMWTATMALNGLIGTGVPQDWTTHMIGHELTSLHSIDHARTLTILLPSVMRELKASKKEKLLQYARNVWNLTDKQQDDDATIETAIVYTENFFRDLGLPVSLADADLTEAAIDPIIKQLDAHKMVKLGEHGNNDLTVSRRILQRAVNSKAS
ncbi:MAG: iron-containing alcohol dehydrogenase [Psychrobacter sp.]|jgi:NADP-dependent alcohol dehydrogenase|uniref:iron-containing alcohol dehydrogenase n=1 Tax=Psychrobacter TaxID=497 RepID=UPI001E384CA0|nr:iron-containing alcohol dehydrogenase [Psychrobacter sp. CCUG 69069]MCD1278253.1 iron-containing alcohol dehydrogenase [Psychrobacter sp. CCUG 69069]MCD6251899.1 iron-containing alcohol dehydrogenase [Psychrobacter sp.]